jgi:hypothetical protein
MENNFKASLSLLRVITVLAGLLIAASSLAGILCSTLYAGANANWATQTIVQDYFDLTVLVPVLLITGFLLQRRNPLVKILWTGAMVYTLYTFVIYCFSVRFNAMFPAYCLVLGLAFYSLLLFFTGNHHITDGSVVRRNGWHRFSAIFLLVFSVLFYLLWTSEVGKALAAGDIPASLKEAGLYSNPVHVLDLSIVLPGMFITGLLLLRKHTIACFMAPAVLFFSSLMALTIASITIVLFILKLTDSYIIGIVFVLISLLNLLMVYFTTKQPARKKTGISS